MTISEGTRVDARRVGLTSSALIIGISLTIAALIDPRTFIGPVGTFFLSYLPAQAIVVAIWAHRPGRLMMPQPARGMILAVTTGIIAAIDEFICINTVGDGRGTSTPQIAMFSIVAVIAGFWVTVIFDGWPFKKISNDTIAAAALLFSCYAVALTLYYLLFNFSFLPPHAQIPHTPMGLFNAWYIVGFLVTAISGMFLPPAFGFLGLERFNQPARGLVWTILCLLWATMLFGIGVGTLRLDPVTFIVWVSIPLLFGGLIVLIVFHDSLFGGQPQRLFRGVLNVFAMAAIGSALVWIYHLVARGSVTPPLSWGPPTYHGEIWVATATLSFTFPLLAIHADLFSHWPLRTGDREAAVRTEAEQFPGI